MENANYPRYVSVYDVLLHDIQQGIYPPGSKLPGENELARQFNVSRNTLRQAILLLHEDGYVANYQGKGTFILKNHAYREVSIEKVGNPLVSCALDPIERIESDFEIRKISPKNREIFGLDASKLLMFIKTVYHNAEGPVGCSIALIPYDTFSEAKIPLDDKEAVSDFYKSLLEREDYTGISQARVTTPRDPVDRMLGVSGSQSLLMLDEVIHDSKQKVVMTQKLFMLPHAYELTIIRRPERPTSRRSI